MLGGCRPEHDPVPGPVADLERCVESAGLVDVVAYADREGDIDDLRWIVQFGGRDTPFDIASDAVGAQGDLYVFVTGEAARSYARDPERDFATIGNMVVVPWGDAGDDPINFLDSSTKGKLGACSFRGAAAGEIAPRDD